MVLRGRYHMRLAADFVVKRRVIYRASERGFRASSRAAWRREGTSVWAIDLVEATHQQRYGEGV